MCHWTFNVFFARPCTPVELWENSFQTSFCLFLRIIVCLTASPRFFFSADVIYGRPLPVDGSIGGAVWLELVDAVVALLHLEEACPVDARPVQGSQAGRSLWQNLSYFTDFNLSSWVYHAEFRASATLVNGHLMGSRNKYFYSPLDGRRLFTWRGPESCPNTRYRICRSTRDCSNYRLGRLSD